MRGRAAPTRPIGAHLEGAAVEHGRWEVEAERRVRRGPIGAQAAGCANKQVVVCLLLDIWCQCRHWVVERAAVEHGCREMLRSVGI